MMRGFYIKTGRAAGYYCSKCGKYLPDDRYNMEKHATICWKRPLSESQIIKEGGKEVYTLEAEHGKLCIAVSIPYVMENPPEEGGRTARIIWNQKYRFYYYSGGDWKKKNNNLCIEARAYLARWIKEGEIIPGTEESESEIIHRVFPGILAVYDMRMFDYIYRNKGYHFDKVLPEKVEKELLKLTPGDLSSIEEKAGEEENTVSLQATVCRYRKEIYILRIVAGWKGKRTVFLFSRGYAACSDLSCVEELLEKNCRMSERSRKAVALFDRAYPDFLLRQYMQYSDNILVPLVAPDYHSGMELAAKAGVAAAEKFRELEVFDKDPSLFGNLKNMFGLPPRVLRAVGKELMTKDNIDRLVSIFKYNPEFLHFDVITPSMMEYYHFADLTHCRDGNMARVTEDLTDQQNLRILRYLAKRPTEGRNYCDYLILCDLLEDYVCGFLPDIPLTEACEKATEKIEDIKNEDLELAFKVKVHRFDYRRLTTCGKGECQEEFKDERFAVIAPEEPEDLYKEGKNMHNCVGSYTRGVAFDDCRIYFLREKEDISESYGTLEVVGDKKEGLRLIQAKGFANESLSHEAMIFVAKWCRIKGIRVDSYDLRGIVDAA